MNRENLLLLQFCLVVLIMGILIFKSVNLKINDSSIEYAALIYAAVIMILGSVGSLLSVILIILDFCK